MAYYSQNGSGIDAWAYIYVQLQVTRTDYATYSHFDLKSVAVSDTGTSGFIKGQVTTNQGGTSWTAVTGWKDVYYNSTTTLAISSFNVDRGASDKTVRCGAYAQGGGTGIYAGGTDYAWLNVTVPKVLSPNAPTGCTATYVSDSQATVSWTNGTTDSNHPRDNTLVERRDGSNDWAQVASASGTASGYTDNGISPNTQYQYRVRAKNVAGYSAYSTGGSIYTTPAAPSSVTLDKTAATTVQVDVTGTWGYAVTYDIESTYDGGSTWASVATSTSLPYSATVNAGTVQFRVRAVKGALSSAWTNSASLVTICPPLAPTIVQAPANPTAFGDSSAISWTPNHPDGSAQESAEVKVTYPGGTSTTYSVSTATSYSFTPNATGTWTAQVRTKGLDPSYGEWSQTVSWGVYNPPSVVITSPATDGTDIVALPLNVAWTVTDSTGVSTQRIIIEGDGQILNRTLAGDVRTVALNASDVALENGQTYTIRLRVMGGSGLVTEQTRIFDVSWLAPAAPLLQITEGEGRSATIDVMSTTYHESGTVLEASSAMMESLTIHGKSVQDGTPTPSAPVPIESVQSRNILKPTARTVTSNGITYTCSADGLVTLSGTATATNWFTLRQASTFPAGTYTASKTGGTSEIKFGNNAAQTVTKTYSANWSSNDLAVYVYQGSTYDESFYVQLERGDTASDYMPYGAVELCSASRNILSPGPRTATDKGVTYTCASDGTITLQGTCTGFTYFTLKMSSITFPAGTYTFSKTGGESNVYWIGKGTERDSITQTTTGDTDISNLCISVEAGKVYDETFNVQLERGSTATEYVPCQILSTTPIPVTLRSLPDGTHDEWVSGESADTLVQRVGETMQAVTDGVTGTVGVDVLSSTGEIANGAQVLYKLATPVTTTLPHVTLPYVDGSAWVDAEVTPSIEATFRPVDFPDQPAADSVDVIRVNADGSTWTVATGLTVGGSCIDPLPPLGVPVTYRATSSAASGSTASSDFLKKFGGRSWVLNFGNAAQEFIEFSFSPETSNSLTHGGTGYHFADGGAGNGLPVFYPTTDRDISGTWKFNALGAAKSHQLKALLMKYPTAWLRDPFGERFRAHVNPSASHGSSNTWVISMDWEAERFREAWDG